MYYYRGRATQSWHSIAPKIRIVKNVLVLGCSFLCVCGLGFAPIRTYLSLSTQLKVLGPLCLGLFYAVSAGSCLYGSIVARRLTYKLTIALSCIPYGIFIASVAYSHYYTLLVAVLFLGIVQGPLWNSAVAYLVNMAAQYAYFSYKTQDAMVRRFLSLFNCLLSSGAFLGHLLSAGAFSAIENSQNHTIRKHHPGSCGRKFCNSDVYMSWPIYSDVFPKLSTVVPVYFATLAGGITVAAAVLALFPLGKMTVQLCSQTQKHISAIQLLWDSIIVFRDSRIQLMLPLFIVSGIGEAFLVCDVMKAFVSCIAPRSTTGYVLFCSFCVSSFLHAFLCSVLKHINRLTVLGAAAAIQLGSLTVMWMWNPVFDDQPILYVVAASWQMAATIWKALCESLVYKFFPENWEAPFGGYFLSNFLGQCIGFFLCPFGCFEYKLYSYGLFYMGSLICFCTVEIQLQNSFKIKTISAFDKIAAIS